MLGRVSIVVRSRPVSVPFAVLVPESESAFCVVVFGSRS